MYSTTQTEVGHEISNCIQKITVRYRKAVNWATQLTEYAINLIYNYPSMQLNSEYHRGVEISSQNIIDDNMWQSRDLYPKIFVRFLCITPEKFRLGVRTNDLFLQFF